LRQRHNFQTAIADNPAFDVSAGEWNADHVPFLRVSQKTANYTIVSADQGTIVEAAHSAAITFTLPAASSVADDWTMWISNRQSGTGAASALTITRAGSDTIDGVTSYATYPGDLRIIRKSGASAFESILLKGGVFQTTSTTGENFIVPAGYTNLAISTWGAGGGGAGGERQSVVANGAAGGNSGGGGARVDLELFRNALAAGTSLLCTAGVGGPGGTGLATNGGGSAGSVGGTTTVTEGGNPIVRAFGGGGGGASGGLSCGGGGGGSHGAGGTGGNNAPGEPGLGAGGQGTTRNTNMGGVSSGSVGGGGNGGWAPAPTMFGGGGGGAGEGTFYGYDGGNSLYGGSGGGPGGALDTAGAPAGLRKAGKTGIQTSTNGRGGGGTAPSSGNGTAGSSTPGIWGATEGGVGGGPSAAGTAGNGGTGGIAGGGGGGGASNTGTSGNGGAGGNGLVRITYG
jgi:hypothetical protein